MTTISHDHVTNQVPVPDACDLYTWGSGTRGMLGHKDEDREKLPRVVESLLGRDVTMVACSSSHTLALSGELGNERQEGVFNAVWLVGFLTLCVCCQ